MHSVVMHQGIHMQIHTNLYQSSFADYWGRFESERPISSGALHLSPTSNRATVGEIAVFLRPMEFRLLHFFMTHPNHVYTREQLLARVWGDWVVVGERTVDVHIRRLRATLEPFGLEVALQTVHCRGYIFTNASQVAASINYEEYQK
jgi:two-component system phosphate regulon response regulator PhoB